MVIAHVIPKQAQKMTLVQSHNVIQELTTATSDPTLGGSVLPGRLHARSFRCQTRRLQERRHRIVELSVLIQDHMTIRSGFRKCFAQLLDDPVCTRVPRYVEVQDLPTVVFDYKKAVEQLERQRRNGEEVESDDYFAMVLEKCPPPLPCIATPPHSPQIASDSPFRDREAEFNSSAWILGAPQSAFSCAKRRISSQISAVIFGRPLRARERQRQ
jgi:hypothetical protein